MFVAGQPRYHFFSSILDNYYLGFSKNLHRCRLLLKHIMSNTEDSGPKASTSTDNGSINQETIVTKDNSPSRLHDNNFRRAHSVEHIVPSLSFTPWSREPCFYWNWPQTYPASEGQYHWPSDAGNYVPNPYCGLYSGGVVNPVQNYFFDGSPMQIPPPNFIFNPLCTSQSFDNMRPNMHRRYSIRRNYSDENVMRDVGVNPKVLKVLSKRYWEDVKKKKKSSKPSVEFTLMSYNVLAQNLINEHPYLYKNHNPRSLQWERRWKNLYDEICKLTPDIMCLQEVQESHLTHFYSRLESLGYKGIYKKRTGIRSDGCAIYYKTDKFNLVEYETVEFYQPNVDILNRDNVAIIAKFSPNGSSQCEFIVATTHLLYNPKRQDVRLAQTQLLLTEIDRLSFQGCRSRDASCHCPIIITGDFNSTPDSAVYELIIKGVLRYDHLSARRLDNSHSNCQGNVLVPRNLNITDKCQHARLVEQRQKIDKISRQQEESLISLHKSDRHIFPKISSEVVDNPGLFCTGTLSHMFAFKSVYGHGDPDNVEGTTFQEKWLSVDYIFYTGKKPNENVQDDKLKLLSRYRLPRRSELGSIKIPNSVLGSDHLSLVARFKLKI